MIKSCHARPNRPTRPMHEGGRCHRDQAQCHMQPNLRHPARANTVELSVTLEPREHALDRDALVAGCETPDPGHGLESQTSFSPGLEHHDDGKQRAWAIARKEPPVLAPPRSAEGESKADHHCRENAKRESHSRRRATHHSPGDKRRRCDQEGVSSNHPHQEAGDCQDTRENPRGPPCNRHGVRIDQKPLFGGFVVWLRAVRRRVWSEHRGREPEQLRPITGSRSTNYPLPTTNSPATPPPRPARRHAAAAVP